MATVLLAAPQILLLTNAALGLFTELARAYMHHPDADQTLAQQLAALMPGAQTIADQVAAYRPLPKDPASG